MDIYLLRHGLAMDREDPKCPPDPDRPLIARGVAKTKKVGRFLRKLGIEFDVVLSSPWLRAFQTAKILCREIRHEKRFQISEFLIPGQDPEELVQMLHQAGREKRNVLLVGHEPGLSILASLLLTGHPKLELKLKKSGLCKLRMSDDAKKPGASLLWLLTPETMS
jgi:phosphohistidine phosphatase